MYSRQKIKIFYVSKSFPYHLEGAEMSDVKEKKVTQAKE